MKLAAALRQIILGDEAAAMRALQVENGLLREALRDANAALRRYKMLVADLRDEPEKTLERIKKAAWL